MIRRNLFDEHDLASWLLISQLEHARLSGELAQAWHQTLHAEVLAAIAHHDDGWAAWEASPQLDSTHGRPRSFVEMPIADAIAIWTDSIVAASRWGWLAGALVAGHFLGLERAPEQMQQPLLRDWLIAMQATRSHWLAGWLATDSANTRQVAEQAQQMLLTADLLSLWLCCDGPIPMTDAAHDREPSSRSAAILGTYHFTGLPLELTPGVLTWRGVLDPWPLAVPELPLTSPALLVPAAHYSSWEKVTEVARPITLCWELRKTLPDMGEC